MGKTYYLVYEVNMLRNCDLDVVEGSDMMLFETEKEALIEMERRKQMYIDDKDNGFTYMPEEGCKNCIVFADELWDDGISRDGKFHIRLKELTIPQPGSRERFSPYTLCEIYNSSDLLAIEYLEPFCYTEEEKELYHVAHKLNLMVVEGEYDRVCNFIQKYCSPKIDFEEEYYKAKWKLFEQFGVKNVDGDMIVI